MEAVIEKFRDRVNELDRFFEMLRAFETPSVTVYFPEKRTHKFKRLHPDWFKTLKATSFLLIYNLVEASVREGLSEIYDAVREESCCAHEITEELRRVWVNQAFLDLKSVESFQQKGNTLVEAVVQRTLVNLDRKKMPIAGNLDAKEIRDICDRHGLSFSTKRIANKGAKLGLVKTKRNALAHGDELFQECGRDFTVAQLTEAKHQAERFVLAVLLEIKRFIIAKEFKI